MKRLFLLAVSISVIIGATTLFSGSSEANTELNISEEPCKIKICACCGLEDLGFNIYELDGTFVGSVGTGSDGCMTTAPIGPFAPGTTFYVEPSIECPTFTRTYFTLTCCGKDEVQVINVLCCLEEDSFNKNPNDKIEPEKFSLFQNYPNPFNPVTRISFNIPVESFVNLTIYDITGKKIATLIDGVTKKGYNTINWNASNLSSGIYFYKLEAGSFTEEKKMILIK
jgi:hypothetical protein